MGQEFLLVSAEHKLTKTGRGYYDLRLSNQERCVGGKMWNDSCDITEFVGKVLYVGGELGEYNGEPQYTVTNFTVSDKDPWEMCVRTKFDIETMVLNVWQLIDSIGDTEIQTVVKSIFDKHMTQFKLHTAAQSNHHAFVGGLLQHSLCVATAASKLCSVYQVADRDIVVAAALLHDIGKLYELSDFPNAVFTRLGSCVGHPTISIMEITPYLEGMKDTFKRDKLLNCIAAHHGRREWGAAVLPVCIEAWIVHVCDQLDAKVEYILEKTVDIPHGEITGYLPAVGSAVLGL